jgi:hypothetical protein
VSENYFVSGTGRVTPASGRMGQRPVGGGEKTVRLSVEVGDQQERKAEFNGFPGMGSVALLARSPLDVQIAEVRTARNTIRAKSLKIPGRRV